MLILPRCQRGQDIGGATTETGQRLRTFVQLFLLSSVYQDMTLVLAPESENIFKLVSQILKVLDMSSCPPDVNLDSFFESICDS